MRHSKGEWIGQFHQLCKERLGSSSSSALSNSCLALGVHKGGSTMLHNFIQKYIENVVPEYRPKGLNIPGVLFSDLGLNDESFDDTSTIPLFIDENKGTCFYGWRNVPMSFFRHKAAMASLPAIALIRDPRDCVVSAYFSFLKTHRLPKDHASEAARQIISERDAAAGVGIDEWALNNIDRFCGELSRVALFMHCNLRIYRYEDIWLAKREFLRSVVTDLGFPFMETSFEVAFQAVNITPGSCTRGHVRKGDPGDHLIKLSGKTRAQINSQYQDLFQFFGYQ